MRSDVPVGGYLSGGVDSSIVCGLASQGDGRPKSGAHRLRTFSVTFDDPALDESAFQLEVANALGSDHIVQHIASRDIAEWFPTVVQHMETPVVRTAPVPLFLLSRLVREHGIKVVLTGEGADEVFWGYDLFKEVVVRLFCLRQPASDVRPRLFDRLYPYLARDARVAPAWRRFFLTAGAPDDPLFSHTPRMLLATWIRDFYSAETREALDGFDAAEQLGESIPQVFESWSALERAAYLELVTLLSPYLLSSQGDRVAMAHGIETRVPFLDHQLFEFAAALPERSKLRGLREKDILRRWAAGVVPPVVKDRPKQPYRAPDVPPFFGPEAPDYVADLLDEETLEGYGIWDGAAVKGLVRRCQAGRATGVRESQALVGILSTQLWYRAFCEAWVAPRPLDMAQADVLMDEASPAPVGNA
jgi:asparagine synthase (glutamine-hydrolysing)